MQAVINDRDQFAPPRPPGRMRAIALAVLAHAVLVGALTWGVNWKGSADQPAVEAELWAAVPQQAAPRAEQPPAPQPPEPTPQPTPSPAPALPPPPPRQAQPDTHEADIALQQQKKKREEDAKKLRQQQLEQDKKDKERHERQERQEQEKKERLLAQKAEREKAEREKLEREKAAKAEQEKQKKLAEEKRRKAEDAREAKEADARHQANIRRMQGLAGATGGETATGTTLRSAGPSGGYGGKVAAAVRPNITFTEIIAGNPAAEVEVRTAPDGTITSRRLLKSSGNKSWDEAVLRALDKTERLPRDVDGRVPPQFPIVFRPKD